MQMRAQSVVVVSEDVPRAAEFANMLVRNHVPMVLTLSCPVSEALLVADGSILVQNKRKAKTGVRKR